MSYKFLRIRSLHFVHCFVCCAFLLNGNLLGDQVFTDTFDSTSYNTFEFNSSTIAPPDGNIDDISFSTLAVQSLGGNPGGFGQITHEHDVDRDMFGEPPNGDGTTFVQSFHDNQIFSYNPQTDGVISEIQFSLDYLTSDFEVDSVFFIVNDTNGGNAAAFLTPVSSGNWETVNSGPLFQTDFSSRDFAGSLDLEFGFGFVSSADVFVEPATFNIDVDNFVVDITTVPEPSSSVLILTGLVGLAFHRRKR